MESKTVRPIDRDEEGFTRAEGLINKPVADLHGRFCHVPFDQAEIHLEGQLFICCPTYLPTVVGTVGEKGLLDQFNSAKAQEVRQTILDGSFTYCHKLLCPFIQNGTLPKKEDVTNPRHRKIIDEGIISGLEPLHVELDYDDSCNLSCPSCRTTRVHVGRGPEYEKRKAIQDQIIGYVFDKPHNQSILVTITGSGDPFGAKLFRDLLFGLDGAQYPNVTIRLHTNGVALTRAVWGKMTRIHKNFEGIMVSVDAGNEADYQITRRGGNWHTLLDNLEFLGQKKKEHAYKFLRLNFIVQRDNFRGIPDFIRLGKRIGATHCALSLLNDWGTWTKEEFAARTVWSQDHHLFDELLHVLADPLLDDPIVDLGNVAECRKVALARFGVDGDTTPGEQPSVAREIRHVIPVTLVRATTKVRNAAQARLLAFYLPQFYPIPENNRWWGHGFTEWTNVAKARPLFDGHDQPHIPADLGFYDLRVTEARQAQADLAKRHHIEGFCYWHYWFHGKRLLERPFDEVLASGQPDFPFCLSWANETWSRRWHGTGSAHEVLQEQTYSPEDDLNHIRWLIKAFADPRYVTIDGRPLFLVYKPGDLPDPKRTTDVFRSECVRHGLPEPYLLASNSHADRDYREMGFDRTLEFEPQLGLLPGPTDPGLKIYDYASARQRMASRQRDFPVYPCIFVRWDNTPRRVENGIVFTNSTPEHFERGLTEIVQSILHKPYDDRVVFVNAWNEWAEGNHLEPDVKYGLRYLEAVRRATSSGQDARLPPLEASRHS